MSCSSNRGVQGRRLRVRIFVTFLAALFSAVSSAETRPRSAILLQEARAANARMDLDEAMRKARQALAIGDAGPGDVWQIYVFLAETASGSGQIEVAVEAYRRALELHPALELAPDSSPRFLDPFRRAKKANGTARLTAVPASSWVSPQEIETRVRIEGDGAHLVQGGRLYVQSQRGLLRIELARTDVLTSRWQCERQPCGYYVALTDANGNELLWAGAPALLLFPPAAKGAAGALPVKWYRSPGIYAGAAAGLAAATLFFALRTSADNRHYQDVISSRSAHTFEEALRANQARQVNATLTVATGVTALGAAATAVFVW
jgi:tetratricopeptide (TPR) repeat protein